MMRRINKNNPDDLVDLNLELVYRLGKGGVEEWLRPLQLETKTLLYKNLSDAKKAQRERLIRAKTKEIPPFGPVEKLHFKIKKYVSEESKVNIENAYENHLQKKSELNDLLRSYSENLDVVVLPEWLEVNDTVSLKGKCYKLDSSRTVITGSLSIEIDRIDTCDLLIEDGEITFQLITAKERKFIVSPQCKETCFEGENSAPYTTAENKTATMHAFSTAPLENHAENLGIKVTQ